MSLFRKVTIALCVAALSFSLVACEKEGPAEKAGKQMDQAADAVKEKAKKLFD